MFGYIMRKKFGRLAKKWGFIRQGAAMVYCCLDRDTPAFVKVCMAVVLVYVVFPFDMLPDIVPVLGWLDDMGALAGMVWVLKRYIKAEHWQKSDKLLFFHEER